MEKEQKLRETIIWLAGLLSTDGTARLTGPHKNSMRYTIYSCERDWLEQVKTRLSEVGIKSTIYEMEAKGKVGEAVEYVLHVHQPYRITRFLRKYAEGFMIQRKWSNVISAYRENYSPDHWIMRRERKFGFWTPEEDQFLIQNYGKMPYREIAKKLGRGGKNNIQLRVRHLRKMGILPQEDLRDQQRYELPNAEIVRLHWEEGVPVYRIAEKFGVSRTTIARRLDEAGVGHRTQSEAQKRRFA